MKIRHILHAIRWALRRHPEDLRQGYIQKDKQSKRGIYLLRSGNSACDTAEIVP